MMGSIILYTLNLKKGAFLACIGFVMLTLFANIGLSWQSGYDNRVSINYSSDFMNDTAISLKFNVSIGCVDTVYCNDSAVNFLWSNGTEELIPYYFENITNLWIKVPQLNNTNNSIDVYFNASNITQNSYYNGSKTFIKFADFENETGVITSFGALAGGTPRTNTTEYYKGIQSLSLTDTEPRIIHSFGALTTSAFVEMYYKCSVIDLREFFFGSGTTTSWGSTLSYKFVDIKNVWTKIRIELNGLSATGNLTQLGTIYKLDSGTSGTVGQFTFPGTWNLGNQICKIDEWYYGKYYPEDRFYYVVGSIENAPPVTDDFLILNYINPDFLNISSDCDNITMTINPHTSEYPILNCSLWLNDTLNYTENQPLNDSTIETSLNLVNGSYAFYWDCYAGALYNTTINYTLNVMCPVPIPPNYSTSTSCPACYNCVPTRQYCADNQTLYQEIYRSVTVNGALTVCNETRLIDCPDGCKNNKCNPTTYEAWLNNGALFIGVLVAFIVVVMAGRKAKGIRF